MESPAHFRASVIGHFYGVLPSTLTVAPTGAPGGGIFVTAVNGDGAGEGYAPNRTNGTLGGILPGTNLGSYGRGVNSGNINTAITKYNQTFANNPTAVGQVLISNNLFTLGQLQTLGGVTPKVNPAPINESNNDWLRDLDLSLNWTYKVQERVELQPGVSFFNVMNFANLDPPKNTLSGVHTTGQLPVSGTVNGTSGAQPNSLRVGLGSGAFGLGSPRGLEFSLKTYVLEILTRSRRLCAPPCSCSVD